MPAHASLHPCEWLSKPWQCVHVDYVGPFQGTMFTQSTTSAKTIESLRSVFARNGLPEILVNDNGPQFTSEEVDQFTTTNGIKHMKAALYHTGWLKDVCSLSKQTLRPLCRTETGKFPNGTQKCLTRHNQTPANLRTRLDALKPDLRRDIPANQMSQAIRPTS